MRNDCPDFSLHNSNGFRSMLSTDDRILRLEFKIDQMTSKLDMILDSLTKPAEKVELPQATIKVKPENIAPDLREIVTHWSKNFPSYGLSRPAALDVNLNPEDEEPSDSGKEPKRTKGRTAIEQLEKRIKEDWGGLKNFRVKAGHGLINASVSVNKPRKGNYYTHILRIADTICNDPAKRKFQPALFGISEVQQTVEYLRTLGVNVNTSALDNQ